LVFLIAGRRLGKVSLAHPEVIFTASFALLPFLVFNQQVITGRSIQPFHYEVLIANYIVLVGLVMMVKCLRLATPRRTVWLIVSLCLLWATVEVNLPFRARSALDAKNDEMVPVLLRLKDLATLDGTWDGLRNAGHGPALVFSPEYGVQRLLPTWAPQGSLLATGSASFQSSADRQNKEWLYTHLYYAEKNEDYLRELLNERADDRFLTFYSRSTIFGPERTLRFLGGDSQPIRQDEIEQEVRAYESFASAFSREQALKRPITYAVVLARGNFDFFNLDRWYVRDAGETVGDYTLYRLKLRE
jgi:hypothetical protein